MAVVLVVMEVMMGVAIGLSRRVYGMTNEWVAVACRIDAGIW